MITLLTILSALLLRKFATSLKRKNRYHTHDICLAISGTTAFSIVTIFFICSAFYVGLDIFRDRNIKKEIRDLENERLQIEEVVENTIDEYVLANPRKEEPYSFNLPFTFPEGVLKYIPELKSKFSNYESISKQLEVLEKRQEELSREKWILYFGK